MKNKKVLIIALIIVIICSILFGVYNVLSSYLFTVGEDGKLFIPDPKKQFLEMLETVNNKEERKFVIDSGVEQNFLTQEEANELY